MLQILPSAVPGGISYCQVVLSEGDCIVSHLAQTIQTAIKLLFDTGDRPNTYSVHCNSSTDKFTVSSNYTAVIFVLLADAEVPPVANVFSTPASIDANNLNSISRVIGNTTPATDAYTSVAPYTTRFIDLVPFKTLN